MNTIQTLKGFRDFLPKEALKRKYLKDKIISVFEKWGYDPLETPTLEPLELFAGQIGEDEKLFFKFKDNAGRDVALRYDQTVPTCRIVGQYSQELPMPFRRYQIQSAFRAENPQKGRYREFLQCDADIFGLPAPYADAEVIALSLDIYKTIGFKQVVAVINDRELLKDLPYEAVVAIDKLEKIGEDGVIDDMVKKGIDEKTARGYLTKVKSLQPNDTLKKIFDYLDQYGFDSTWYRFDPTLARSFSYSTGPIWEVKVVGLESGSLLGGERFDQLIKKVSGIDIPGVGFAVGFDRTLEAAEALGLIPEISTKTQVLVTQLDFSTTKNSLQIAKSLRDEALDCEVYPTPDSRLDKQLKYANKKGIPFVLIIGPLEAKENRVILKNMKTGDQTDYSETELPKLAQYVRENP